MALVIAHISDLHLDLGARAEQRAVRVLDYLASLTDEIDAVLVTGDIADHGLPAEYTQARGLLAAVRVPVMTLPGNHDERANWRAAFTESPHSAEPINTFTRVGNAVFALCDSTVPGRDDGYLHDTTLTWLDELLTQADTDDGPSFVCFHHPPVTLHMPYLDSIRQAGADRLDALIRRHPSVVAVLCGHAHTPAATQFAGLPLLVAPGVASTVALPWETAELLDLDAPPGVAFHILDDNGRLTTHFRVPT
ncbi:MAG: 3,5-cyclic-AMP phosphodiesterase [Frankiaceae bacterium]|jgi:3',5'-cyclic AMP phosphodiesterase CpdA|nr:3,5-cyclic-AMP phosphodiesterase [Frankiaceae bacterium]